MNWFTLLKVALAMLAELIGGLEKREECPGGVCPPVLDDLQSLQAELDQPRSQSASDFLKCLDFKRFLAAISECIAVIRDALSGVCPPKE